MSNDLWYCSGCWMVKHCKYEDDLGSWCEACGEPTTWRQIDE